MSGTAVPIILHHTPTDINTPAPLYAGELAVGVGPTRTKIWVGEGPPTNVNRLLISTNAADNPLLNAAALGVSSIADPTTAGNFLRTNTGTWVAGLPLTGGTMDTVTATAGGITLNVNDSSWSRNGLTVNSGPDGYGIGMTNTGDANAIDITTSSSGSGINIYNSGLGSGLSVVAGSAAAVIISGPANMAGAECLRLSNVRAADDNYTIRVLGAASVQHFAVVGQGGVLLGPGLTSQGIGTINVSGGYYVNGVQATLPGGGSQYQALIKGTGTAFGWADPATRTNNPWSAAGGFDALALNTGSYCTAFGVNAVFSGSGSYNSGFGIDTLKYVGTGSNNVAAGAYALSHIVDVSGNVALGDNAGNGTSVSGVWNNGSSDSIFIGIWASPQNTTDTNEIVIGTNAVGGGSNTVTLGNNTVTRLFIGGLGEVLVGAADSAGTGYRTLMVAN